MTIAAEYSARSFSGRPVAGDTRHSAPAPALVLSVCAGLVLYTVIFGSNPFAIRTPATDWSDRGVPLLYLALYGFANLLVLYVFLTRGRWQWLATLSLPLVLLLAWAGISTLWSQHPQIAASRFVQLALLTFAALVFTNGLGPKRALATLRNFLLFVAVVDWASLAVLSQSIHLQNEVDTNLIGSWRGLHIHKNVAAPLMAVGALLFLANLAERKSWRSLAGLLVTVGFLVGTNSRTSIAFFAVSALILLAVCFVRRPSEVARLTAVVGFYTSIACIVLWTGFEYSTIVALLTDPALFSGRGELWRVIFAASEDIFLGAGYGSFWRVALGGPSFFYATGWHASSFNGHNGYLDLFVTLGLPGMLLGIVAFVVHPISAFLFQAARISRDMAAAFSSIVFIILHNTLESTLLMWNADTYFIGIVALIVLRLELRAQDRGDA